MNGRLNNCFDCSMVLKSQMVSLTPRRLNLPTHSDQFMPNLRQLQPQEHFVEKLYFQAFFFIIDASLQFHLIGDIL